MNVLGYAAKQAKAPFTHYSFERREPKDNDVVIDIQYCGICHTDTHQVNNEWGGESTYPMVPGHEITGIVKEVGSEVTRCGVGDRVGVGCFVDSCRKCGPCLKGLEQYCIEGPRFLELLYFHSHALEEQFPSSSTSYSKTPTKLLNDDNFPPEGARNNDPRKLIFPGLVNLPIPPCCYPLPVFSCYYSLSFSVFYMKNQQILVDHQTHMLFQRYRLDFIFGLLIPLLHK